MSCRPLPSIAAAALAALVLGACPEPVDGTDAATPPVDAGADAGPNTPPVAHIAGPAEQQHPRGFPIELDGAGSSDPDGDALFYFWSVASPPGASACVAHQGVTNQSIFLITPPCDGDYRVELFVQDARAASSPTVHTLLHVVTEYYAVAGGNRDAALGQAVELSAAASVLPTEPGIVEYNWQLLTRPAGSGAVIQDSRERVAQFTPTDPHASYLIELDVTYEDIPLQPDRFYVNVLNSTPVASAGADVDVAMSDTVALDGSGSSDPDEDSLSYAWVLQAPELGCVLSDATTARPTLTAGASGGSVTVELTVRDVFGGQASDTVVVRVQ